MMGQLAEISQTASPTSFHQLLNTLDESKKLLRVYTQNIDCLEKKSGLSFGVPEFEERRRTSPAPEVPRCVPLHGHLQALHCLNCKKSFEDHDEVQQHIPTLIAGSLPTCPECEATDDVRLQEGKRSRGIGKLRPSVVLYNEVHVHGEGVGEAVRRDLVGSSKACGRGADLLLVVGTSLKVPGTKRIVREFSRALHARSTSQLPTPESTPTPTSAADETGPVRSIYLNLDFPVPNKEWEGVFDVWVNGDAQTFAHKLTKELRKADEAKAAAAEKKAAKEAALATGGPGPKAKPKMTTDTTGTKRKSSDGDVKPAKKRKHESTSALKEQLAEPRSTTGLKGTFKAQKTNTIRIKATSSKPGLAPIPAKRQTASFPHTLENRAFIDVPPPSRIMQPSLAHSNRKDGATMHVPSVIVSRVCFTPPPEEQRAAAKRPLTRSRSKQTAALASVTVVS
jgi:NAD-dependent SIR2 family protein deacetylase